MKASRLWLSKYFDAPLPGAGALAEALTFHAFEIDGIEKAGEDDVLDVKVTPNRGHDCLSHRGIALELSAILNVALTSDPLKDVLKLEPATDKIEITVEAAELCPRYIAGYIRGVTVGPSPQWLRERLEAVGQRSINNVVDATNFVMFNLGQPLHAFDAGKLSFTKAKYRIGVRRARVDEQITALDGKQYALGYQNLLITDEDLGGKPIGIAGVKGGIPAAITGETKDIIIESANFDGVAVRKSAMAVKLRTDASARFEQGLSPYLAGYGMQAAVELIQKLAGGELVGFADTNSAAPAPRSVAVSASQVRAALGETISPDDIHQAFERLGFAFKVESDVFTVEVPWVRLDLSLAEDLIEEVGRIAGYDKIPARELPALRDKPALNVDFYWAEHLRDEFTAKGYTEVFTSVFAEKGERIVLNKADGVRPYLRSSLIPGLEDALMLNKRNKELLALQDIKLFEIGTVWHKGGEEVMVATVSESAPPQEMPLASYEKPLDQWAKYQNVLPPRAESYRPYSKYPYIVRDVALWVPDGTKPDAVESLIKEQAGELAVKISLFDTFEKQGRTSLAYRLIFQSFERTLTEVEVHEIMEKVSAALKAKDFEIR